MAEIAIYPPIHLTIHPDEPIRSLQAAAKVVRRHGLDGGGSAHAVLQALERARTEQEIEIATRAFRAWADAHGLLLVPPENA